MYVFHPHLYNNNHVRQIYVLHTFQIDYNFSRQNTFQIYGLEPRNQACWEKERKMHYHEVRRQKSKGGGRYI